MADKMRGPYFNGLTIRQTTTELFRRVSVQTNGPSHICVTAQVTEVSYAVVLSSYETITCARAASPRQARRSTIMLSIVSASLIGILVSASVSPQSLKPDNFSGFGSWMSV